MVITLDSTPFEQVSLARERLGPDIGEWSARRDAAWIDEARERGSYATVSQFVEFFESILPTANPIFESAIEKLTAIALEIRADHRAVHGSPVKSPPRALAGHHGKFPVSSRRLVSRPISILKSGHRGGESSKRAAGAGRNGGGGGGGPPRHRAKPLEQVFEAFDLDGSGDVSKSELLALGEARRKLGQKQGNWSAEANQRCLAKIDADGNGQIEVGEFVRHFSEAMPWAVEDFESTIQDFLEVAI